MKTTLVIVALLGLLVLAGCTQNAMPAAQTPTDKAVGDLGNDVSGIDSLTADLDTSDLNSLDQELADIDNLELQ